MARQMKCLECPKCKHQGEFQSHAERNQHVPARDIYKCVNTECGNFIWYVVNDADYEHRKINQAQESA